MSKTIPIRQRIRQAILLTSMLLFPVTMNYLSPYVVMDGAVQGLLMASPIIFTLQFITALFFGRFFCGWICPAGAFQDACLGINNQPIKNHKIDWIKWMLWFPWLGTILYFLGKAGESIKFDPLHLTETGVSVDNPVKFITYYLVVLLFVLAAVLIGRRGGCHVYCWMAPFMILGRKLGNAIHLPGLHLKADPEMCTGCKTCTANCPMSLNVNDMVMNRQMENSECILCGKCVDNCHTQAIYYNFR
ncbi:4Fe-4S binding protein [Leptolinea tardivitalis]|uniref:4Fe-4S ferredoxin-type domain-containing protein n=1 Tax=Leptolinea tardivitalis TaxID=229920 RepID=A0A0P6XUS9_9CHLR|nr:4Fe-4S binding protein [Leptolinea tardivitalis]KPL73182.1 hypothetical protein ADM99_02780 [Leptolinea tardivitalis]GAP21284.1 protein containing 4Fe-4S binding domain [Leptolinea tardivitalis]